MGVGHSSWADELFYFHKANLYPGSIISLAHSYFRNSREYCHTQKQEMATMSCEQYTLFIVYLNSVFRQRFKMIILSQGWSFIETKLSKSYLFPLHFKVQCIYSWSQEEKQSNLIIPSISLCMGWALFRMNIQGGRCKRLSLICFDLFFNNIPSLGDPWVDKLWDTSSPGSIGCCKRRPQSCWVHLDGAWWGKEWSQQTACNRMNRAAWSWIWPKARHIWKMEWTKSLCTTKIGLIKAFVYPKWLDMNQGESFKNVWELSSLD